MSTGLREEIRVGERRVVGPQPMSGTIAPDAPPEAPEPQSVPLMRVLMPIVMVIAVVGMVALMFVSGMGRNPMSFLFPLMMVVSTVGMMATGAGGAGGKDISGPRRDYQRHLSSVRRAVAKAADRQREAAEFIHPDPQALWQIPRVGRAFERSAQDSDFMVVRLGRGTQQPATPVAPPAIPAPEKLDPVSAVALREVIRDALRVERVPLAIDMKAFPLIALADGAQDLGRALIGQVAALHHPKECAIVAVDELASTRSEPQLRWDWLKWLPHHWHHSQWVAGLHGDEAGAARLRFGSCSELSAAVGQLRAAQRMPAVLVVVLIAPTDGLDTESLSEIVETAGTDNSVVILSIGGADSQSLWDAAIDYGLALSVDGGKVIAETESGSQTVAEADALSEAEAEVLARGLAAVSWEVDQEERKSSQGDPVLSELGLVPPRETVRYRERLGTARLRIPVGAKDDGSPVYLDFKESAEGGMGPHGLCIGATGSGKSEFLRSVVVGLAATHSPQQLNFVLVDFKGGATFLGLDGLPHVSAVITNLEDELSLVNRMEDALRGEMTRRQELLRASGNYSSVAEYEQARRSGTNSNPPLPALLIVVDEFSELLSARPEFAELFVAIGRLGRSLHMHLLLASQRLEEGRLRGLESHLSYRVALKTFSAAESRSVLGAPDAFDLPAIPGIGFIKSSSSEPVRFRSAYVSGPVPELTGERGEPAVASAAAVVAEFSALAKPNLVSRMQEKQQTPTDEETSVGTQGKTILESFVSSVEHIPIRAHRVWLPPLPAKVPLDLSDPEGVEPCSAMTAAIGLVDKPLHQRQDTLSVDLRGTGGHVAIVGAPQSGKTNAVRTLTLALARQTAPEKLHFYVIDFGAGGLSDLASLPHVSSLAHRADEELIRRIVGSLRREIVSRERRFRENNWLTPEAARAAGNPDAVLIIDGWSAFRAEHLALSDDVSALISDGLSLGIHVVLTAHRWSELRPSIRDLMGTRIELRQAEAIDSVIDRKAAELVPTSPGRGVAVGGLAMLIAYSDARDTALVAEYSAQEHGRSAAPELRLLPRLVEVDALPMPTGRRAGAVPIGLEEAGLGTVVFHPEKDRHLLIFGAAGSGRTSALMTVMQQLQRAHSESKFVVVDYRRGLMEAVAPERMAGYAGSSAVAAPLLEELAERLRQRLPSPEITPAQLKARNWWSGPAITLVVDDYDLVVGSRANPLAPLADIIPHAADIGLNIVFARRISGALRSLHDPVMGAVKDQGATVFVMSGTREDGPIMGIVPTEQPPGRGHWIAHGRPFEIVQFATVARQEES
ncbi:type VII secretion protein EccCa [Corynebacterium lactis]|uniref:type VII secretion protein EccCa n=1 Tax=Corynebacterium lactis TaxID=1231000 RepID=UPI000A8F2C91|nr:type VII secretion protein EccCa [Corynebacterium lactis]